MSDGKGLSKEEWDRAVFYLEKYTLSNSRVLPISHAFTWRMLARQGIPPDRRGRVVRTSPILSCGQIWCAFASIPRRILESNRFYEQLSNDRVLHVSCLPQQISDQIELVLSPLALFLTLKGRPAHVLQPQALSIRRRA